jgi:transposase
MDQRSFFGLEEQLARISACGDPLETLERTVDFETFRSRLVEGLGYGDGAKGGRPPFDPVSMFKLLILQTQHNLSDARAEFMLRDRLSWMRFAGFDLCAPTPDENTIRHFRNKLTDSRTLTDIMGLFDALLREKGFLPMSGRIVDASLVPAPNDRRRLAGLLRQLIFSRLAGYEDVNDADRLRQDPVMRQLVGGRAEKRGAASASAMGRFETAMLTRPENLAALADLPGRWIDAVHDRRPPKVVTLDMDSSESPVHGEQEGAAWNGHFQSRRLHPLFVFNQFGDLERCALRPGNVHSADGWEAVLRPVLERYSAETRPSITRRRFRADAAFA